MTKIPPFDVKDSVLITLALGKSAHNLLELRDRIAEVPAGSLLHHFYEGLLRPSFDDPEYRNDFALWARRQLFDGALAERLGILSPFDLDAFEHRGGESLREALLGILEDRLTEISHVPAVGPGREFHFLCSQVVVFPLGRSVSDPAELAALTPELPPGSIFYHFIDARFRPPRGENDFSSWLSHWGEEGEAARERLARIDPLFGSLADLGRAVAAALAPLAEGATLATAAPAGRAAGGAP